MSVAATAERPPDGDCPHAVAEAGLKSGLRYRVRTITVRRALRRGRDRHQAQDHTGLPGVQAPELHHQEEPAQRPGPAGADEVLPALPAPPAAPRDPLAA